MKNYTNSSQLGSLPDEIVDDILLCLPAKSLLRFKLVSKLWKSLISDPNFAESHLNRSGNRLRVGQVRAKQETGTNSEVTLSLYSMDCDGSNREVVNQDHDSGRDYISISYHDDDVRVLGSCNGLLLVSTHYRLRDLFLWNPTTGLCRRIVNCVENLSTNTISGLVYDSRSGNYKIIVNAYLSNCNIFDFKLDRWTEKEEYYDYRIHTASSAIMVNGVPHWCVYRHNCPEKRRRRRERYYLIVYFDLETETFKELVSKSWKSLISDPNFAESHLNRYVRRNTDNDNLLRVGQLHVKLVTGSKSKVSLSLYSMDSDGSNREVVNQDYDYGDDAIFGSDTVGRILGSCNGLLLVCPDFRLVSDLILWNPSTGQCKRISICRVLDFSNSISGLVYDSRSGNYKAIMVYHYTSGPPSPGSGCYVYEESSCNIYDFKLNCWTKTKEYFGYRIHTDSSAIMVNGVPHWCVYRVRHGPQQYGVRYLIVYFDLETEKFNEVKLPEWAAAEEVAFSIGILRGCLCMCLHSQGSIQVWTMKEYGIAESWTKSFVISSPKDVHISAICLIGKDQVLMKVIEKKVVQKKKSIKKLSSFSRGTSKRRWKEETSKPVMRN
ncbi:hypothetical protein COLO4_31416 [Corchorus olitorius]|uniref:F-box domain-containing protein n=1 Tax=Corchorus olitorius TaxID=93759 RepID=A0A1R3H495_9ROSI|nr:hypothetical protein COLO4_31416 [Corchorus olitorius]